MSRRSVWMLVFAFLLMLGIGTTIATGELEHASPIEALGGCAAMLLGLLPPVAGGVKRFAGWLEGLSPRGHAIFVGVVALLLPAAFSLTAWLGGRPLVPMMHDEQMYLLQARQLASGHLAMPALPLGDFFETFYILVRPVYASMYFPGTALAYVPAIWLHLPYWVWPMAIMTGLFIVTYLVASRIFGRFYGLLVLLIMLSTQLMRWMPTATMSHPLGGLLGMLIFYGWLRWRASPRTGWAMLIGIATGWLAITRPLESFCFTLPVAIAVLGSIRRESIKRIALHIGIVIACTVPFVALQLADDYVITGHWLKTPMSLYIEQEFPGMTALGDSSGIVVSKSTLPQKQDMVKAFIQPTVTRDHTVPFWTGIWKRFIYMLSNGICSALIFPLLIVSLALLGRAEVRVLVGSFVLFNICYLIYNGYNAQYTIQMVPVLNCLIVGAVTGLVALFDRRQDLIRSICSLGLVGVSAGVLAIMPQSATGNEADWRTMEFNYTYLPKSVQRPAIILFHYGSGSSPFVEPVYNLDAATPDDCPIIRAHDLGPARNIELFRYYAARQPQRNVYLFDRDTSQLRLLGTVAQLATNPAATAP